ncbi:unnamed protein product, partial [Ectocarpus sp. 4 AP-2014]
SAAGNGTGRKTEGELKTENRYKREQTHTWKKTQPFWLRRREALCQRCLSVNYGSSCAPPAGIVPVVETRPAKASFGALKSMYCNTGTREPVPTQTASTCAPPTPPASMRSLEPPPPASTRCIHT